jgi:hypothetical protein
LARLTPPHEIRIRWKDDPTTPQASSLDAARGHSSKGQVHGVINEKKQARQGFLARIALQIPPRPQAKLERSASQIEKRHGRNKLAIQPPDAACFVKFLEKQLSKDFV